MKKLMIMALMILGSSVAFAGQSDALKAVLKAKTFDEAFALVKSNLNSFANNSEKATAYNKLTDLAMEKVTKEQTTMTNNQLATQMKTKLEPVDTVGFYKAAYDALSSGLECEKYDILPNEKGKVKAKFHDANRDRLWPIRAQLINYGQRLSDTDKETALSAFGTYVSSHDNSLFKDVATKSKDEYLGEVSRVAAVYAYQSKNMDLANKYIDIALQDSATFKQALDMKIFFASQGLKTKEDSVKFQQTLEDLYVKNPNSDTVFGQLAAMYQSLGQKDKAAKLITDRLVADPKNYTALAMKAQNDMNSNKFDDAIAGFKNAIAVKNDEPLIYAYIGFCINSKAAASQNPTEVKNLYTESIGYLEKSRSLDPNRERANWAYPLYQCYYSLYGDNDSRTKEVKSFIK